MSPRRSLPAVAGVPASLCPTLFRSNRSLRNGPPCYPINGTNGHTLRRPNCASVAQVRTVGEQAHVRQSDRSGSQPRSKTCRNGPPRRVSLRSTCSRDPNRRQLARRNEPKMGSLRRFLSASESTRRGGRPRVEVYPPWRVSSFVLFLASLASWRSNQFRCETNPSTGAMSGQ